MLIAFWLNLSFALLEAVFGFIFRSSAVMADAVHDLGDALAIGLSAFLEKISKKKALVTDKSFHYYFHETLLSSARKNSCGVGTVSFRPVAAAS